MSINCYVNFIAVFVEHPRSINAVDGTEVQISCIGINTSLVLFEVNGILQLNKALLINVSYNLELKILTLQQKEEI